MPKQPEKKKDRTNDPSLKGFVVYSIIIILLFPLIINLIMFIPASLTSSDLDAKTWLSFWGSYGGGIIGGVGALLAVLLTIRYYMAKDAEQKLLLKLTPLIERISFLQQQVYSREIIKDETLLGLDVNEEIKAKIKEYNKLVPLLKGIFAEQAIGTLIGVCQLKNEDGEMFFSHSTLNYFQLPKEIRELANIIAGLSLYPNCTELLCNDPRLAYIISVEGGGSAGMWPYRWHTTYMDGQEEAKKDLANLFSIVDFLTDSFNAMYQEKYDIIYKN